MRPLSDSEERNASALLKLVGDVTYLVPTDTGLRKSIMDATASIRAYLKDVGFHDYEEQGQGVAAKSVRQAVILDDHDATDTRVSLYRPETKSGDPRIWISGLPHSADAGDIIAIFVDGDTLFVYDLTRGRLADIVAQHEADGSMGSHPVLAILSDVKRDIDFVADELLLKLRGIARHGWIDAVGHGNTAIGRTLESALGIAMNSSKDPDYKGIEIKASRARSARGTRQTLFAQVADWSISDVKSSGEILDRYGYEDANGVLRLSVQVDHGKPNSKGLGLEVDFDRDVLHEVDWNRDKAAFATWSLDKLRGRLREKHGATFWVKADSELDERGVERFRYTSVEFSSDPFAHQLGPLIANNAISMDHLIKRKPSGGAHEQGPLFKIDRKRMQELFPPMKSWQLLEKAG